MAALAKKQSTETKSGVQSAKSKATQVGGDSHWTIARAELKRRPGRPTKIRPLFKAIAEKIPYAFLSKVMKDLERNNIEKTGVYIAHDSMGYPRYIGRGSIPNRLQARKKAQLLELEYFSFFVVKDKVHEREIETIMIRSAGPLLDFNYRKVRTDIQSGDVRDFEPGTLYFERQYRKGPKKQHQSRRTGRS
ncbi:MAG TPA: hypothetical protein VKA03_10320 [Methylovirgula sp.]|nr:hypothetical protein [Methylovirgula sp.]